MPSLAHQAIVGLFRATQQKKIFADGDTLRARVTTRRAKPLPQPTAGLRGVTVTRDDTAGFPIFTVSAAKPSGKTAMYMHGGTYVADLRPQHWRFVAALARDTGVTVVVPQYPLAPEHTIDDSFATLLTVATDRLGHRPMLMGDSAGGGYALALAQQLGRPATVALISPWLDVAMAEPPARELAAADPWLAVGGLRAAGLWWSANRPERAETSPLHHDLAAVQRLLVVSGTRDILHPQARTLAERAGAACELVAGEGLIHCYPLLPIPEARPAGAAIARFLAG